jgi:hypothetical protein
MRSQRSAGSLAPILAADPVAAFDAAPLGIRQAVIRFFVVVRLMPVPQGSSSTHAQSSCSTRSPAGAAGWQSRSFVRSSVRATLRTSANWAHLGDAELIATAPGIPSETHQMELTRGLEAAIQELTAETVAGRQSLYKASARIAWLNAFLVVLTAALVALTVVLAVRS